MGTSCAHIPPITPPTPRWHRACERDRPGYLPAIPHVSDGCLGPARAEAAAIPSPFVKTEVAIPIPLGPRPQRVELLRRNVSGQETIAVPVARALLALRIRSVCKRRHRQCRSTARTSAVRLKGGVGGRSCYYASSAPLIAAVAAHRIAV
jgi:hypothetical protein